MTKTNQDCHLFQGDSHRIDVTLTTEDNTPLDLTGVALCCVATRNLGDPAAAAITKTLGDGIETAPDGTGISIELLPNDTAELKVGAYYHQLTLTAGVDIDTLMVGTLIVERSARMTP